MLIACWTKPPSRGLRVTRSQHHRARRVVMHAKTGCECQPMRRWSAISGMRRVIETGLEFKKGSLAMTGKLPAPASRIQVQVRDGASRYG